MNKWLSAIRLRTLPLALSSIIMGAFLATVKGVFKWDIFIMSIITTIFLQILSNLANDYGDSQNGADNNLRHGPIRTVQSGAISKKNMLAAIILCSICALVFGLILLWIAFRGIETTFLIFLLIGILSIIAAIKYTAGKNPYGYAGLGDISVFLFFGIVGVMGSTYLYTNTLEVCTLLPAISCGTFAVAVLNLNNMRDILPDTLANKKTIPVRIGYNNAKIYHFILIILGFLTAISYHILYVGYNKVMLFLVLIIFWTKDLKFILLSSTADNVDPLLKSTALGTLLFVILFGIGILL